MLSTEIKALISRLPGKIGLYYKNLSTGVTIGVNENDSFIAASVIKLPILVAVFHEISQGRLRRDDIIRLSSGDKVPSCGALNYMHSGLDVTIKDLCNLMIILSDNTATNMLIRALGIERANAVFAQYGLKSTKLNRLLFDHEEQKLGKENYFTPAEIGMLLEDIYNKQVVSEAVSDEILDTLKLQQLNAKIPYLLPKNIRVAHKTGEDSGTTHDVGIVFADTPFILCFASNNTDVIAAEEALRKIALLCCQDSHN